jgi:hypothetical protein
MVHNDDAGSESISETASSLRKTWSDVATIGVCYRYGSTLSKRMKYTLMASYDR